MGFFDKLFGGSLQTPSTPDELRQLLFQAASAGNAKLVGKYCARHRDWILEHFDRWTKVPEEIRNNNAALNEYVNGLVAVAVTMAKQGNPKLLESIQGGDDSNPVEAWRRDIQRAQGLLQQGQYDDARALLEESLMNNHQLIGSAADSFKPISLGLLAQCHFHSGKVDSALAPAQEALHLCESVGDLEGVNAYLQTTLEIFRYLGRLEDAAKTADRLAELSSQVERLDDTKEWQRRASLIRAGEPPCRIQVGVDNHTYEVKEAPARREARVQFQFCRNRISVGACKTKVAQAKALGGEGKIEEALAMFQEAARLDPYDPEPHYQSGVALMDLGRAADAAEEYRATEERAPGWFHCRFDLWLSEQIAMGSLPHEAFHALRALEDAREADPARRRSLAEKAAHTFSAVAPIHLELGRILMADGKEEEAVASFRRGLEVSQDPDSRTRLMVELAVVLPQGSERRELLKQAADLKGNLVAAAMAEYFLRVEN